MSVPKWKVPKPGEGNSLSAQVKGLQSSVQQWDGRLKEFEKCHRSVMSQHDAKISKMATKLKAIRVKLKTGNKRIKTLESKLRDAVESNDGNQDADDHIGRNIFPESKSFHEEPIVMGSGIGDVAQADEEKPTVAKRKSKRDSSQGKRKKHTDNHEEVSAPFEVDTNRAVLSKSNSQNYFSPKGKKNSTTHTGFQKKEFFISVERMQESEILKFSPKKNESGNSVESIIDVANSDIEANKESPISVNNESVTTDTSKLKNVEETKWSCNICGETFRYRTVLKKHRRNFHRSERFLCQYCNATFMRSNDVKTHALVHSKNHKCSLCSASYNSKDELARHFKYMSHCGTDAKRPFQCSVCLMSFVNFIRLDQHAILSHEHVAKHKSVIQSFNVENPPSESPESSKSALEITQEFEDFYECPVCGKNYKSLHQVGKHLRKHGGKNLDTQIDNDSQIGVEPNPLKTNPFQGNDRPQTKKYNGIDVHLKIQESYKAEPQKSVPSPTLEIPSVLCSQSSESTQNFVAESITSTIKKTYECPTCHKNITEEKKIGDHKKLHTRGRVYTCPICTKRHTVKLALTKHLKSEHPDKHCHECPVCESMHFSINNLHRHVKRHNVQDIYKCNKCTQSFLNRYNWKDHLGVCAVLDAYTNQSSKNAQCNKIISIGLPKSPEAKSRKKVVHKCETCSGNFSSGGSLRRHIKNVHLKGKTQTTIGSNVVKNKIKRKIFSKVPQPTSQPKNDPEGKDAEKKTTGTVITCHNMPIEKGKENSENSRAEAEQSVKCLTCQKVYASPANLRRHEKTHQGIRSKSRTILPGKNYACNFCKELHVTWAQFQDHMGAHEQLFTKIKKLPSAFRGRPSITKFLCSECNKECETSDILKVHFAKTHAWKKNYKCKVKLCDRSFCTSEGLRRHGKLHHKVMLDMDGL